VAEANTTEGPARGTGAVGPLLWHRRWIITAVTAVGAGAALVLAFTQTPTFASTASVLVQAPPGAGPNQPNMATERNLGSSTAVAQIVVSDAGLAYIPEELLNGLSVNVPVDTDILEFHYSSPIPAIAQQRAQAFAEAYLTFRSQQQGEQLSATERSLRGRIGALNGQLRTVEKSAASTNDPRVEAVLSAEVSSFITQIGILQQSLAEVNAQGALSVGRVVEPAALPTSPSKPNRPLDGAVGLFAGLLLGIGAAIAIDRSDDRLRGRGDLEATLGAPALGAIPLIRPTKEPRLVTAMQPGSPVSEAFRQLRANVIVATLTSNARSILVTSFREKEGTAFTLGNLGVALAGAGQSVVMVSADLGDPRLEQLFGVGASVGLADVLLEKAALSDVMWETGIEGLMIVPSGNASLDKGELEGSRMPAAIRELRQLANFVLIEAAPLLPIPDAAILASACDGALLVVDARSTTRGEIREARQQLERANASLLGAVLVNTTRRFGQQASKGSPRAASLRAPEQSGPRQVSQGDSPRSP
jgi:capsular exopolysaccharide synthesis family protein